MGDLENVSSTVWHRLAAINDFVNVKSLFAIVKSHLTTTQCHLTNDESHLIVAETLLAFVVRFMTTTKLYIAFVNSSFDEAKSDIADALSLSTLVSFDLRSNKSLATIGRSLFAFVNSLIAKIKSLLTNINSLASFANSFFC